MSVKRYKVSNGLLIIHGAESYNTFNLLNVDVVLASDYDWMRADRDSQQRIAIREMERADAAEARIAALEADNEALREFAEFCDYHHRSCTGLQGQHLECDCGYSNARDELRATLTNAPAGERKL